MPSSRPQKGINDLATLHPSVAAEADGGDSLNVIAGSTKKCHKNAKKVINGRQ